MKALAVVVCLGLELLLPGQLSEAERLTNAPMDTVHMLRSIQLMESGDDQAKRSMVVHWAENGQAHRNYLTELTRLHTPNREAVNVHRAYRELIEKAASAMSGIGATEGTLGDLALRRLAQSAGAVWIPVPEYDVIVGCGVGVAESFSETCQRALKDLATQRPERLKGLLNDKDPAVFAAACEALNIIKPDWVSDAAAKRSREKDVQVRCVSARYLASGPVTARTAPLLKELLNDPDGRVMATLAWGLSNEKLDALFGKIQWRHLPAGARYCYVGGSSPKDSIDLTEVALLDPDIEVAARAAMRIPSIPVQDRWLKSKRLGDYFAMRRLERLVGRDTREWLEAIRSGGVYLNPSTLGHLSLGRTDALEWILALIPELEKIDMVLLPHGGLVAEWPRFKPAIDRMLASTNLHVRRSAAEAVSWSKEVRPLYKDAILNDLEIRGALVSTYGNPLPPEALSVILTGPRREDVFSALQHIVRHRIQGAAEEVARLAKGNDRQVAEHARIVLERLKEANQPARG